MPALEIITKRTKLKYVKSTDLAFIHELHSIPEVDRFNTLGIPKNSSETKIVMAPLLLALQEKEIKKYTFCITRLVDKRPMGLFGLTLSSPKYKSAEIWYKLHPDYWNQGYATEIVKEVVAFAFSNLQLHRVTAGCAIANKGSIKVLKKAGFTNEGTGRQTLPLITGWSDNYEYVILETDTR